MSNSNHAAQAANQAQAGSYITTQDGVQLYYKDCLLNQDLLAFLGK
jgi:non-heme chloroperoxidase